METRRNIKITKDETMKAHKLNKICTFLLFTTSKKITFFFHMHFFGDIIAGD